VAYPESCGGAYISKCIDCINLNRHLGPELQGEFTRTISSNNPVEVIEEEDVVGAPANAVTNLSLPLGLFSSCVTHANNPLLRTKGNVLFNPATKNIYESWLKYKDKLHVVQGCGQLYPSEVRKIREHLLIRGDPVSLQMWVMVLLGIRMFLRSDELISLTVEDFIDSHYPKGKQFSTPANGMGALTRCQVVQPDSVCSLAGEAQGKRDDQPVRLALLVDEKFPEFCPVRHLLWYLKVFNIKTGYLFPPAGLLIDSYQSDSTLSATKHITYDSFRSTLKHLVGNICQRDTSQFLVGTHTLRKTAYLFAVWGCMTGLKEGNYKDAIPRKSIVVFSSALFSMI
jgi:hypothetical protein